MTGSRPLAVAVIVGSPRRRSFRRSLVQAIEELKPDGMHVDEVPIGDLPSHGEILNRPYEKIGWQRAIRGDFLPDIEGVEGADQRESVLRFWHRIKEADAVLVITLEPHSSLSGMLTNAFAWAAPIVGEHVLYCKPAAGMGSSVGRAGTPQPPLRLREVLVSRGTMLLPESDGFVTFPGDAFDAAGTLVDAATRERLRSIMSAFDAWLRTIVQG